VPSVRPTLRIDRKSDKVKAHPLTTFSVGHDGGWRFTRTVAGKVIEQDGGCLLPIDIDQLNRALSVARWKRTPAPSCGAYWHEYTEYTVEDRLVHTARTCDPEVLDEVSKQTLLEIERIRNKVSPGGG
nr:hypothetical protein [Deltaproteobacteria bacterium]